MIKFISHENCPDDPFIKEICYLSVDDKFRFAYVRKAMKNGNLFWGPMSAGITINGQKKYFDGIEWDSNFLKKDILAFLEARSWENKQTAYQQPITPLMNHVPQQPKQMSFLDECPF